MRRALRQLVLLLGLAGLAAEAPAMPPAASTDPVIASAVAEASSMPSSGRLARLIEGCRGDLYRFIRVVLGERGFWGRQIEVCRSIDRYDTTLVPAGNSVGKSFMAGRIALAFLLNHRNSIVYTTSPSQYQLIKILWKEVNSAILKSRFPIGIAPAGSGPIELALSKTWYMIGHVSNKIENTTGHHCEHLLVLIDEGSGVPEHTYAAAASLNPSRTVIFGNPLHPHGEFYEKCRKAEEERDRPDRSSNLIRISSMESPHIHLERSPYGLADQGFLKRNARDYGEDSIWWLSHVLAQFPDVTAETCVPKAWLDLACQTLHLPGGHRRIAIDCAGGNGGDEWVILGRDDNGVFDLKWSADWSTETAAKQAKIMASQWGVPGFRVSFDAAGLGWDFGNRLAVAGLKDARPYLGGASGGKKFKRLRSACAQLLRFRLDPGRKVETAAGLFVPQVPFSFGLGKAEWHPKLREVGQFLRFLDGEAYELERGADIRERLKRSPDTGDAFFQSFAFRD